MRTDTACDVELATRGWRVVLLGQGGSESSGCKDLGEVYCSNAIAATLVPMGATTWCVHKRYIMAGVGDKCKSVTHCDTQISIAHSETDRPNRRVAERYCVLLSRCPIEASSEC